LRAIDVPTGLRAERYGDRRQPDAGDFVAVGIDGAHSGAVDIVDPRRRVDPVDGGTISLPPGGTAKPDTAGIVMVSAVTAVPTAIRGTQFGGGTIAFATHSSSARNNAHNAGAALCVLRGLTQGPGSDRRGADPVERWHSREGYDKNISDLRRIRCRKSPLESGEKIWPFGFLARS
jgi:hypothetical protein